MSAEDMLDGDLPGMWERSDFTGGRFDVGPRLGPEPLVDPRAIPDVGGRDLVARVENLKVRNRLLRDRPDLPVDRLPVHDEVERLQEEVEALRRDRADLAAFLDDESVAPLKRLGTARTWLRTPAR